MSRVQQLAERYPGVGVHMRMDQLMSLIELDTKIRAADESRMSLGVQKTALVEEVDQKKSASEKLVSEVEKAVWEVEQAGEKHDEADKELEAALSALRAAQENKRRAAEEKEVVEAKKVCKEGLLKEARDEENTARENVAGWESQLGAVEATVSQLKKQLTDAVSRFTGTHGLKHLLL